MEKMIRTRKDQLQKRGVKGFTLMEMLIVIAIIAVLVAIAIPIFTAQLNKAKVSADAANIRSGYAEVSATILSDGTSSGTYYLASDGTVTTSPTDDFKAFKTQGEATNQNVAGQSLTWTAEETVSYTVSDSKVNITVSASSK